MCVVFSTKLNLHFKVSYTHFRCDELQLKIVAETNDPEWRGEFELEKKLHLAKTTIKTTIKNYFLHHFLELINFNLDYLETIIYGLDPP